MNQNTNDIPVTITPPEDSKKIVLPPFLEGLIPTNNTLVYNSSENNEKSIKQS